jgi:hypothetical protein
MSVILADAVRSAFPFEVEKFRLSGPDNMISPHFGLFRSDTSECVGMAVSEKYVPHSVEDITILCDACQAVFPDFSEIRTHWREGHYVFARPSKEYRRSIFVAGDMSDDTVWPELRVSGGYDGKPFRASLCLHRDRCLNLMILTTVAKSSMNIRHTTNMRERMKELVAIFQNLNASWPGVVERAQQMAERDIVLADYLHAVFPEQPTSKRGETVRKDMIEEIIARVENEHRTMGISGIRQTSGWTAFNAVQGYQQHSTRQKQTPMNRMILALDNGETQELLRRAERIALGLSV